MYNFSIGIKKSKAHFSVSNSKTGRRGIWINSLPCESFFSNYLHKEIFFENLRKFSLMNYVDSFFVEVIVAGGGFSSQLEACRVGSLKAIVDFFQLKEIELKIKSEDRGAIIPNKRPKYPKRFLRRGARGKPQLSFR